MDSTPESEPAQTTTPKQSNSGPANKRARLLRFGLLVAPAIILLFLGIRVSIIKGPGSLGNAPEILAGLTERGAQEEDFTFLVFGDTKTGTATFKHLLRMGRKDSPAFAIVVGDFVCHPELINHKLFVQEISAEKLPFPLLMVPGNHDLCPEGPFRLADYEKFWGAAQFHFTYGNKLFICLNDAPPYDKTRQYLSYLRTVLSQKAHESDAVFVFMHAPAKGLNPWVMAGPAEGSEEFMRLIKDYNVRYIFCGHHHGYIKTVKDGATFIVTGGGGDRLRGEHGRFHHFVRVAVQKDDIVDSVFAAEKKLETFKLLKRNIVLYIWPFVANKYFVAALAIVVLATLVYRFSAFTGAKQPPDNSIKNDVKYGPS
ncbi:MAG: metallophosphoesterase family protein [Planctomycetota bacterium]|jgi:Icc-related predicted phosphoesterase